MSRRLALFAAALATVALGAPAPASAQVPASDDAGSGRDAGTSFETAVPIQPGVVYTGSLHNTDPGLLGEDDWFAFEARAGQVVNAAVRGDANTWCTDLIAPDGTVIASDGCTGSLSGAVLPVDGTYALDVRLPWSSTSPPTNSCVGLDAPASLGGSADLGTPV